MRVTNLNTTGSEREVTSPVVDAVTARYPYALTPFLRRRAEAGTYSPAAMQQFIPSLLELERVPGYGPDPTGEIQLHHGRAIVRAYENRLVVMMTQNCLVYCRFCFAKDFVGNPAHAVSDAHLREALAYIAAHGEIIDVLLSGGDPLAMPDHRLIPFLRDLAAIPTVRVIRIDSRALTVLPSRLEDRLVEAMAESGKTYYYAHANHPDDVEHPAVEEAIERLLTARIPVLNQSVILAGVNDDPDVLCRLLLSCYGRRVLPYHLYLLDRTQGTAHFDVPRGRIVDLYRSVSTLPGPAQPALVWVDRMARKHRLLWDDSVGLESFLDARDEEYARAGDAIHVPVGWA